MCGSSGPHCEPLGDVVAPMQHVELPKRQWCLVAFVLCREIVLVLLAVLVMPVLPVLVLVVMVFLVLVFLVVVFFVVVFFVVVLCLLHFSLSSPRQSKTKTEKSVRLLLSSLLFLSRTRYPKLKISSAPN